MEALVRSAPDLPGEPVAEEVGQQEQRVRGLERGGAPCGDELEDRVEGQLLQAVDGVLLLHVDRPGHQLGYVAGAGVAVAVGVAQQLAVPVEQAVVDGPRVDPDAVEVAGASHLGDPGQHLAVDAQDVPEQRSADRDGTVGEPVHLL